jgi:hypothetical protein
MLVTYEVLCDFVDVHKDVVYVYFAGLVCP